MYILPAIDLIGGKCVRLIKGQYDQQINYKDNPVEQAVEFLDAGSDWLHIVDLDGAKQGTDVNFESIKAICASSGSMKVELGGGIRDEQTIAKMLDVGVERLIIGTRAINEFDWFCQMAEKYPGRLVLGLDARGAKLATEGWLEGDGKDLLEFAVHAANLPLAAIVYTDIDRDGMMTGPNLERTKALVDAVDIDIVAAGGVTAAEDIVRLDEINVAGAIIGRALYEGKIELADALKTANKLNEK